MKSTFIYKNELDQPITFVLEPWAEEFELLPAQKIKLVGEYKNEDAICQLIQTQTDAFFYAWDNSLIHVFIDGNDVTRTSSKVIF